MATGRFDQPAPGAVAWLDIAADNPDTWTGRLRTGPLAMQISPQRSGRHPYAFSGARLRGTRCIWSAATVSGAELYRAARSSVPEPYNSTVHILVRSEIEGSVFDLRGVGVGPPAGAAGAASVGAMRVLAPGDEISEQFGANSHLFTLNVPQSIIGIEANAVASMREVLYQLTPFQLQLLRGAVGLLVAGGDELGSASSLVGVDRYLASLAALLLRTAVNRPVPDVAQAEHVRRRTDSIIFEQAADPDLTPAGIAAQLNISLRQLYRAFDGTESPAARIRRRRLERAAEILSSRTGTGQVERVALDCGFTSAEYFSRAFRREFGLSPRAYRSAHREARAGLRPHTPDGNPVSC